MKRMLNAHVRAWHLSLAVVLLFVLNSGPVRAAFRPEGTFRVASIFEAEPVTVPQQSEVEIFHKAITVPTGKQADLYAWFSGYQASETTTGYTYGAFRLDSATGTQFTPNPILMADNYKDGTTGYVPLAGHAYKYSVGAGTHNVYFTIHNDNISTGALTISSSEMTILANIHD